MNKYTVMISDAEKKALESQMADIQEWLNNAIHTRARVAMSQIVLAETNKNPKKLTPGELEAEVATIAPAPIGRSLPEKSPL